MYWEYCSTCWRYLPTRTCWLHPEQQVCPYCCVACPERNMCPNPVWYSEFKIVIEERKPSRKVEEKGEAVKALEELLKKLESG